MKAYGGIDILVREGERVREEREEGRYNNNNNREGRGARCEVRGHER